MDISLDLVKNLSLIEFWIGDNSTINNNIDIKKNPFRAPITPPIKLLTSLSTSNDCRECIIKLNNNLYKYIKNYKIIR